MPRYISAAIRQEFILYRCGEKACPRAGSNLEGQHAVRLATKLLESPEIWQQIKTLNDEQANQIRIDEILRAQKRLAFVDPVEFFYVDGTPIPLMALAKRLHMAIEESRISTDSNGVTATVLRLTVRLAAVLIMTIASHAAVGFTGEQPPRIEWGGRRAVRRCKQQNLRLDPDSTTRSPIG